MNTRPFRIAVLIGAIVAFSTYLYFSGYFARLDWQHLGIVLGLALIAYIAGAMFADQFIGFSALIIAGLCVVLLTDRVDATIILEANLLFTVGGLGLTQCREDITSTEDFLRTTREESVACLALLTGCILVLATIYLQYQLVFWSLYVLPIYVYIISAGVLLNTASHRR